MDVSDQFPSCSPSMLEKRIYAATGRLPTRGALERINCFPHPVEDPTGKHLTLEHLVAVHVTNTFPEGGVLRTRYSFTKNKKIAYYRPTLHFSLNHPVSSHAAGSWDDQDYAILIPLEDLVKLGERFLFFNPVDTVILGDLHLPQSAVIYVHPRAIERTKPLISPPKEESELGRVNGIPVKPLDMRLETPLLRVRADTPFSIRETVYEEVYMKNGKTVHLSQTRYANVYLTPEGAVEKQHPAGGWVVEEWNHTGDVERRDYLFSQEAVEALRDSLLSQGWQRKVFQKHRLEKRLTPFRSAVFNAIIEQGYHPRTGNAHSWIEPRFTPHTVEEGDSILITLPHMLSDFIKVYNLPYGAHHAHWTFTIEEIMKYLTLGLSVDGAELFLDAEGTAKHLQERHVYTPQTREWWKKQLDRLIQAFKEAEASFHHSPPGVEDYIQNAARKTIHTFSKLTIPPSMNAAWHQDYQALLKQMKPYLS